MNIASGAAVTLTCDISAISQSPSSVVWKTNGQTNLNGVTGYTIVDGTFDNTAKTQRTTLALDTTVTSSDRTYTCDVTPNGGTAQSTEILVNIISDRCKCLQS